MLSVCGASLVNCGSAGGSADPTTHSSEFPSAPVPEPTPTETVIRDQPDPLRAARIRTESEIRSWESSERGRLGSPVSDSGALIHLPLDGTSPLQAWYAESRNYQYGRKTLIFEVRRAAQFASQMRSTAPSLRAGDMSMPSGATPQDRAGLRHPSGSHVNGFFIDLSYLGNGANPTPHALAEIDVEATSWVIYSLLESLAVESILTAYRDAFVAQAENWYQRGVVGFEVLARFRNALWQDASLNHTGHMHVNTATRPGLLLGTRNSYYRCRRAQTVGNATSWVEIAC